MLLNISKLSIAGLALMSASALASVTSTINFNGATKENNNLYTQTIGSGVNAVNLKISGWSDTADFNKSRDKKIEAADSITRYSSGGIGMNNQDSDDEHTADNTSNADGRDYDMFLLEFDHAVNLSKATYSWLLNDRDDTQVTVAAINTNNISGKGWGKVARSENATSNAGYNIASGFQNMQGTSGSGSGSYYTNMTSTSGTYSNFWLIGALNTAFGGNSSDVGNDGFKLSGVSFSKDPGTPPPPATSVPEPTSIMMFGLALIGLCAANRRKIK